MGDECSGCHDDSCASHGAHGSMSETELEAKLVLEYRMSHIGRKILVLSGKGGVGKSTVAANLATSLALSGKKVGLLDIDIHGPSIPQLFNLTGQHAQPGEAEHTIKPVEYSPNLKVMSIGFLLPNKDDAVIWRGPLKMGIIKQFLKDVEWGNLDYLIVDSPPGTGDEPLSVVQLLPDSDGAVIVTTPQQLSIDDVRKCINFAKKVNLNVLGVIENMSGFVCPDCGSKINIFSKGGGEKMAAEMKVPYLGSIPIDKNIADACESGKPYLKEFAGSGAALAFNDIIRKLEDSISVSAKHTETVFKPAEKGAPKIGTRIAIPVTGGNLSDHFGHCESFSLIDVDMEKKEIIGSVSLPSPGHQPGTLPVWLNEHGTDMVIAGGMGAKIFQLFDQYGIDVCIGAPVDKPEAIVRSYLDGTLKFTDNACDHEHGEGHTCSH
jgi:Mrp family chromosome partitioning ATPase/predicted Fe-Mo cluster-binding NifX family protein